MAATAHAVVDNQRQHNFTRSMATVRNVLRPALAYHAVATDSIPGIAAMVAVMSRCTASLLATMISRSQTKTGRKREWWFRLRAMQKSYRVIERANAFVCVQANIARQQTNPTGIILAPLLEERRIKRRILSGQVHFVDDCRGYDMIGNCG
jgi:hypothetical protein